MQSSDKLLVSVMVFALVILALPSVLKAEKNDSHPLLVSGSPSIQQAINNAMDGDVILIQNGIHIEENYPVIVNKSVTLTGQNTDEAIIEGWGTNKGIFLVKAHGVRIFNLTVQNTTKSLGSFGIHLFNVKNIEIANCTITKCESGLVLTNSTDGDITRNRVVDSLSVGIYLRQQSCLNTIISNNISGNPTGVQIVDLSCQNNVIYHNNFINNTNQQIDYGTANNWDSAYPSGGNYWSDHDCTDRLKGPDQNITGSDGIADISYMDLDTYPLTMPICFFYLYRWNQYDYYTTIVSNSTISDFYFDPNVSRSIIFNVTGVDGTEGFCRVTIPKNILWVEGSDQWVIKVNETNLGNSLIMNDDINTYLYFGYNHSIQTIQIIGTSVVPEFSTFSTLMLLALFSAGFILTVKLKHKNSFLHCD